jgi:hypothetical protein
MTLVGDRMMVNIWNRKSPEQHNHDKTNAGGVISTKYVGVPENIDTLITE